MLRSTLQFCYYPKEGIPPLKFIVDCMLGRLAKWLKILGFDTLFFSKIEDDKLLRIAQKEKRMLLTRDTELVKKAKGIDSLFVESEEWKVQLAQVLDAFSLGQKVQPYSRCIECNVVLKELPKEKARNLVTPFVIQEAEHFALCPECGRVFWKGTHHADMASRIEQLLEETESFRSKSQNK